MTIHSDRKDVPNNHDSEEDCYVCCQWNDLRLGPKLQHRNSSSDFRRYYHHPFEPEVDSTKRITSQVMSLDQAGLSDTHQAKPKALSTYSASCLMKPPWTGRYAVISPMHMYCSHTTNLSLSTTLHRMGRRTYETTVYAIAIPAGPAYFKAVPVPTQRPVPMPAPKVIIMICRFESCLWYPASWTPDATIVVTPSCKDGARSTSLDFLWFLFAFADSSTAAMVDSSLLNEQ